MTGYTNTLLAGSPIPVVSRSTVHRERKCAARLLQWLTNEQKVLTPGRDPSLRPYPRCSVSSAISCRAVQYGDCRGGFGPPQTLATKYLLCVQGLQYLSDTLRCDVRQSLRITNKVRVPLQTCTMGMLSIVQLRLRKAGAASRRDTTHSATDEDWLLLVPTLPLQPTEEAFKRQPPLLDIVLTSTPASRPA